MLNFWLFVLIIYLSARLIIDYKFGTLPVYLSDHLIRLGNRRILCLSRNPTSIGTGGTWFTLIHLCSRCYFHPIWVLSVIHLLPSLGTFRSCTPKPCILGISKKIME